MAAVRIETDPMLAAIVERAVASFAPERIMLFGSRARGDAGDHSDYDVMFVVNPRGADRSAVEARVREGLGTLSSMMDIIVSFTQDFEWRRKDVGTLEYIVEHEGHVLYSRLGFDAPARVREERPTDQPRSLPEWIARAQRDFKALDVLQSTSEPVEDSICFHAHQAGEKTLKAVLVRARISPPYRHLLKELLALCPEALRTLGGVADACAVLDGVFPKTRYPDNPIPSAPEVDAAVNAARLIREAARIAGVIV
jgi:HEPN domain-containing protein/predicted nucleotidyltransferase